MTKNRWCRYRLRFPKLSLLNQICSNLHLLTRTPEGTQSYRDFRKIAIRQYGSIDKYVREVILTKNTSSASQHLPSSSEYTYVIRKNDFPYALENGIEHWVIWSLKEMTHDEVEEALTKNFNGKEWMFVINPAHLQSVGSVWHGHIFIRDSSESNVTNML